MGQINFQNLFKGLETFRGAGGTGGGNIAMDKQSGIVVFKPTPPVLASLIATAGGSLATGTAVYYVVTSIQGNGSESVVSNEHTITPSGSNLAVSLVWPAVLNAQAYNIYRGTTSAQEKYLTSVSSNTPIVGTGGSGCTLTITAASNPITAAVVLAGGTGYPPNTTILLNATTSGSGGVIQVLTNALGNVASVVGIVGTGGTGYSTGTSTTTVAGQVSYVDTGAITLSTTQVPAGNVGVPTSPTATLANGGSLNVGTKYFYVICAYGPNGENLNTESYATAEASATASSTQASITVGWTAASPNFATGYNIYRSTVSGQERFLASVAGAATVSYLDTGIVTPNNLISPPPSSATAGAGTNYSVQSTVVTLPYISHELVQTTTILDGTGQAGTYPIILQGYAGNNPGEVGNLINGEPFYFIEENYGGVQLVSTTSANGLYKGWVILPFAGIGAGEEGLPAFKYSTGTTTGTFAAGQLTGAQQVTYNSTATTPGSIATRTAVQMFADTPNAVVGLQWVVRIINSSASANTMTITGGTGVTLSGTTTYTIAEFAYRDFLCTFTSATAVTMVAIGGGVATN